MFTQWLEETVSSAVNLGWIPLWSNVQAQSGALKALPFADALGTRWFLNCDGQVITLGADGVPTCLTVGDVVNAGLGRKLLAAIADRLEGR